MHAEASGHWQAASVELAPVQVIRHFSRCSAQLSTVLFFQLIPPMTPALQLPATDLGGS